MYLAHGPPTFFRYGSALMLNVGERARGNLRGNPHPRPETLQASSSCSATDKTTRLLDITRRQRTAGAAFQISSAENDGLDPLRPRLLWMVKTSHPIGPLGKPCALDITRGRRSTSFAFTREQSLCQRPQALPPYMSLSQEIVSGDIDRPGKTRTHPSVESSPLAYPGPLPCVISAKCLLRAVFPLGHQIILQKAVQFMRPDRLG